MLRLRQNLNFFSFSVLFKFKLIFAFFLLTKTKKIFFFSKKKKKKPYFFFNFIQK